MVSIMAQDCNNTKKYIALILFSSTHIDPLEHLNQSRGGTEERGMGEQRHCTDPYQHENKERSLQIFKAYPSESEEGSFLTKDSLSKN